MMMGRWWCSILYGALAVAPLPAQSAPTEPGLAQNPAAVARDADIVVTAETRDLSEWKRAEADHVIVFSDGGERDLVRIATRLEALHALMSRLYGTAGQVEGGPKLQVMLFDSREDLRKLGLRNLRAEEGPFAKAFADQRYYDPRVDGEVLAIARSDQLIDLDTKLSRDRYCDDLAEAGADCAGKMEPLLPPVERSWEAVLYSAFAQRFVLSNVPAAYPRWYLDGIGALFSTVEFRKDGSLEYARPPANYQNIFRAYGAVRARDILSGAYLDAPSAEMKWTPYHAWLITHFFVFSNPKPKLQAQFAQYMAAIGRGAAPAEAAGAFDDMAKLNREIMGYASRSKAFARTQAPAAPPQPPSVTVLTRAQLAVQEARLRLGDPSLALLSADAASGAGPQWIDQLRGVARQQPLDVEAMLVAAEAACRRARAGECLADADHVLAQTPQSARALAWKGVALTEQALADPADKRAGTLGAARDTLERALQIDPRDPVAAIAYFQSFTKAGEPVPDSAMAGVAKLAAATPAAPSPRLLLGEELMRQGKTDLARRLLQPVLYGAYDSPEKTAAQALFPIAAGAPRPSPGG